MMNNIRTSHLVFRIVVGCFFLAVSNSSVGTVQSELSFGGLYKSRRGNRDTFWSNTGNVFRVKGGGGKTAILL